MKDSTTVRFFRSARVAFSELFTYLGYTVMNSFMWYLVFGLLVLFQIWVFKAYGRFQEYPLYALIAAALSTSLLSIQWGCSCAVTREIEEHDIPSFGMYFAALKRTAFSSFILGLMQSFVFLVCVCGVVFYWNMQPVAFKLVSVVCFYITVMWASACIYQHPLLLEHLPGGAYHGEDRKRGMFFSVIQRSVYMMMANLPYSLAALTGLIVWCVLCVVTIIPMVLFMHVGAASFAETWTRRLLMRYDVIEDTQLSLLNDTSSDKATKIGD